MYYADVISAMISENLVEAIISHVTENLIPSSTFDP